MTALYFSLIVFLSFFVINGRKKKSFITPSSLLIGIYLVSMILSVVYVYDNKETLFMTGNYNGSSIIVLILWLFFLLPVFIFKENKINEISVPNISRLNVISTIFILLSFYAIFYYSSAVVRVFAYGDLGEARVEMVNGNLTFKEEGFAQTISGVIASLYVFCIYLFFVYLAIGGHKWRCILLSISSFSYPLAILSIVGRDGIVFWIFSFFFCFLLFKDYINNRLRKKIIKWGAVLSLILILPFALITVGRFDDNSRNSIVAYIGQSFVNASYYFGAPKIPTSPGGSFPYFYKLMGLPIPEDKEWSIPGTNSTSFTSFVTAFYSSIGTIGIIIVGLILIFVFARLLRGPRFSYNKSFIYLLYFQVLSQGVFYFRQQGNGGNIFIILSILLALYFSFTPKKSNIVIRKGRE